MHDLKKGHQKFLGHKSSFFPKKVISEISSEKFFQPPQIQCQVPANDDYYNDSDGGDDGDGI